MNIPISMKKQLVIVGGGSSAHTIIPLLSKSDFDVSILTSRPADWSRTIVLEHQNTKGEILGIYEGTLKDILGNHLYGNYYDAPVHDYLNKVSWDIFWGPDSTIWIGYNATMPYEMPRFTKKMMDKNIHDDLIYLCGEKEAAKAEEPSEVFEVWLE